MNELASGRLHSLVERLIELQPAVERYRETENLLARLMLSAEVCEIAIAGKGRVALSPTLSHALRPFGGERGYSLLVEPDVRPAGAMIEITPLKGWITG